MGKFLDYLKSVRLNESKSQLLDRLADAFGYDLVFGKNVKYDLTDDNVQLIYTCLNSLMFETGLGKIPIRCLSRDNICAELKAICEREGDSSYREPVGLFYGVYNVLIDNDICSLKPSDKLLFRDDSIFINMDELSHKSFVFCTATLCHEMIHFYDRIYGEYEMYQKTSLLTQIKRDTHLTPTFKRLKMSANNQNLDVISKIPFGYTSDMSDEKAVSAALATLNEKEFSEADIETRMHDIGDIHVINSKCAMITTF